MSLLSFLVTYLIHCTHGYQRSVQVLLSMDYWSVVQSEQDLYLPHINHAINLAWIATVKNQALDSAVNLGRWLTKPINCD